MSASVHHDATGGAWFLFLGMICGLLGRAFSKRIPIPYTVLILLVGISWGAVDVSINLGGFAESLAKWVNINPHYLLLVFLPSLIFGSAFSVDFHVFAREIPQMMLLAGPGVVMSTAFTAGFAKLCMGYDWNWSTAIAFGAMLSATDPVAVVALLKDLGASKRLSLLIEGESLFNDGTAMVVFIVFKDAMAGESRTVPEMFLFFGRLSVGGAALGLACGAITIAILMRLQFDITAQIAVTFCSAYLCFMFAESTPLHMSGVLAVVTLGLVVASLGRASVREHESMHQFWETIEYFSNTLIFLLSGVVIYERGFHEPGITSKDWVLLLVLYVVLHAARGIMLLVLHPALKNIAYGLTWQESTVVVYSGLRGAVGLVLALFLDTNENIPALTKQRFMFHMAGIAALTLLVNGSLSGPLVRRLGLAKPTCASVKMFENAIHHINRHTEAAVARLRHSEFYHDADYEKVKGFLPEVLGRIRAKQRMLSGLGAPRRNSLIVDATSKGSTDIGPRKGVLKRSKVLPRQNTEARKLASDFLCEARRRFLNLVKSNYWEQYEMGMLGRVAIEQLTNAASRCQDDDDRPLHEWDHIKEFFARSTASQIAAKVLCCGSDKLLFSSLSFEYDIVVSFISAHKHVESLFKQLVDDPLTSDIVSAESEAMVAQAQQKVAEITSNFSDMARAVKTHHVLLALLKDTENVAQTLLEHGEIEQKEFDLIKVAVVEAYGRTKLPTHLVADERSMLKEVGYIDDLDEATFDAVSELSSRKFFNAGQVMLPEGRVCTGFFIILRGTVVLKKPTGGPTPTRAKSSRKSVFKSWLSTNRRMSALTPTNNPAAFCTVDRFGPGSVVGVLSMLTGCVSMVAAVCETQVVAAYLPQSKMFPLLKSQPHPSGGPLRLVSPLEEVVCRMATVLVAELMLPAFEAFQPAQIRQILAEAALVRPNPLSPFKLTGKAVLLTGSLLAPKNPAHAHAVTRKPPARADSEQEEYDPSYTTPSLQEVVYTEPDGSKVTLTLDDFDVQVSAFAFIDSEPDVVRFVSEGTRLMVIPMHFIAMFNNCHHRVMESILLHRHLQNLKRTDTEAVMPEPSEPVSKRASFHDVQESPKTTPLGGRRTSSAAQMLSSKQPEVAKPVPRGMVPGLFRAASSRAVERVNLTEAVAQAGWASGPVGRPPMPSKRPAVLQPLTGPVGRSGKPPMPGRVPSREHPPAESHVIPKGVIIPSLAHHLERLREDGPGTGRTGDGDSDILRDESIVRMLREQEDEEVAEAWQTHTARGGTVSNVTWDNGNGDEVGVAILARRQQAEAEEVATLDTARGASARNLLAVKAAQSFIGAAPSTSRRPSVDLGNLTARGELTARGRTRRGSNAVRRESLTSAIGAAYVLDSRLAEADERMSSLSRSLSSEDGADAPGPSAELSLSLPRVTAPRPLLRNISVGRAMAAMP